jgi:multiple antibiotic resistance protein
MPDAIISIGVFLAAFSSLFTIMNPFSTVFIFLTITKGNTKKEKAAIVKKACVTAAVVLVVFGIAGSHILSFFGITIDAFRIAGGIIVAAIGFQMIHTGKREFHSHKERKEAIDKEDVSVIPLAIPMISGPGAITTTIVLMDDSPMILDKIFVIGAILAVTLISYIVLSRASTVQKFLGETGRNVINRIMGLIVLVVGVQFIINGARNVLIPLFG